MLSKLASIYPSQIERTVYFEIKKAPRVTDGEVLLQIQYEKTWMTNIKKVLGYRSRAIRKERKKEIEKPSNKIHT